MNNFSEISPSPDVGQMKKNRNSMDYLKKERIFRFKPG